MREFIYKLGRPLQSIEPRSDTIPMPVPSSYNDVTQNRTLRDHVGWAWYQRSFYFPKINPKQERVFARFGSAHYMALVWINGQAVTEHSIGHLPFEADISSVISQHGEANTITVAVNNTLDHHSIPQVTLSCLSMKTLI